MGQILEFGSTFESWNLQIQSKNILSVQISVEKLSDSSHCNKDIPGSALIHYINQVVLIPKFL